MLECRSYWIEQCWENSPNLVVEGEVDIEELERQGWKAEAKKDAVQNFDRERVQIADEGEEIDDKEHWGNKELMEKRTLKEESDAEVDTDFEHTATLDSQTTDDNTVSKMFSPDHL